MVEVRKVAKLVESLGTSRGQVRAWAGKYSNLEGWQSSHRPVAGGRDRVGGGGLGGQESQQTPCTKEVIPRAMIQREIVPR